jgi:hypothetical protein
MVSLCKSLPSFHFSPSDSPGRVELDSLRSRLDLERGLRRDADCLCEPGTEVLVDGREVRDGPRLDLCRLCAGQVARDVPDEAILRVGAEDAGPECAGLLKVELGDFGEVDDGGAEELLVILGVVAAGGVREGLDRRLVVGAVALVVERPLPVALEVGRWLERRVDRQLLVVDCDQVHFVSLNTGNHERKRLWFQRTTKTVAVGVGVGEKPGLEDRVRRGLDARDSMSRRERDLLDLGKVVLRVLVCNRRIIRRMFFVSKQRSIDALRTSFPTFLRGNCA